MTSRPARSFLKRLRSYLELVGKSLTSNLVSTEDRGTSVLGPVLQRRHRGFCSLYSTVSFVREALRNYVAAGSRFGLGESILELSRFVGDWKVEWSTSDEDILTGECLFSMSAKAGLIRISIKSRSCCFCIGSCTRFETIL